jgi:beta-xylosidase
VTIQSGTSEVWRDAGAEPRDRIADLMARMTLREKVGQLYGVWIGVESTDGEVAPHQD